MKKELTTRTLETQIKNPIKVHCQQCGRKTLHTIQASYEEHYCEISQYFSFNGQTNYQIIQCNGCEFVSFREIYWNSEDYEEYIDDDGALSGKPTIMEKFYPNLISGSRFQSHELSYLPDACRAIYLETEFALVNQQLLLAAIGLRALIEAICEHEEMLKNIQFTSKEKLFNKIDKMLEKGLLPQGAREILHSIRTMGNDSVHKVEKQNIEQLKLAFSVLETLLRTLYVHTGQFNDMKE
jgi:hypothetical protein